jgi:hypothetical protein
MRSGDDFDLLQFFSLEMIEPMRMALLSWEPRMSESGWVEARQSPLIDWRMRTQSRGLCGLFMTGELLWNLASSFRLVA